MQNAEELGMVKPFDMEDHHEVKDPAMRRVLNETKELAKQAVGAAKTTADWVEMVKDAWEEERAHQHFHWGLGHGISSSDWWRELVRTHTLNLLCDLLGADRVQAIGKEVDQGERLTRRKAKAKRRANSERGELMVKRITDVKELTTPQARDYFRTALKAAGKERVDVAVRAGGEEVWTDAGPVFLTSTVIWQLMDAEEGGN